MNLLFDLKQEQLAVLAPENKEDIWYCVPVDLKFDHKVWQAEESFAKGEEYLVVTETRILVLSGTELLLPVAATAYIG